MQSYLRIVLFLALLALIFDPAISARDRGRKGGDRGGNNGGSRGKGKGGGRGKGSNRDKPAGYPSSARTSSSSSFDIHADRQSPIDLKPSSRNGGDRQEKLEFTREYSGNSFKIQNKGTTVEVDLEGKPTMNMGLPGQSKLYHYEFDSLHFHWGSPKNPNTGSEHTINGKSYPIEMHMVHHIRSYGGLDKATKSGAWCSVAVVALFLEAKPGNPDNRALSPIFSSFSPNYQSQPVTVRKRVDLNPILPRHGADFYTYAGSLTTKPFNQVVQWYVFDKPIQISMRDLQKFYNLKDQRGQPVLNNFRKQQRTNSRKVQHRQVA